MTRRYCILANSSTEKLSRKDLMHLGEPGLGAGVLVLKLCGQKMILGGPAESPSVTVPMTGRWRGEVGSGFPVEPMTSWV